jgi:hypothetical protein
MKYIVAAEVPGRGKGRSYKDHLYLGNNGQWYRDFDSKLAHHFESEEAAWLYVHQCFAPDLRGLPSNWTVKVEPTNDETPTPLQPASGTDSR